MLFLLRPRQTYMPYALPRSREQQDAYNQQLRQAYASTRRVTPSGRGPLAEVKELAALHQSGVLTDDEFSAAKAKVLELHDDAT
ncbi:MAG TPA: SHOCT domain-containing protein [Acidimicrobiia bacterium]|nr:SHOCT domain-containing protein [Acidimicrobiia bacterium]